MDENDLQKRLLEAFGIEASEHINTITTGLIDLEKKEDGQIDPGVIEEVYRAAHSMKGAARAVGMLEIERLCQALESCFSLLKSGKLKGQAGVFDTFHNVMKTVEQLMHADPENQIEPEFIDYYVTLLENIQVIERKEHKNAPLQNDAGNDVVNPVSEENAESNRNTPDTKQEAEEPVKPATSKTAGNREISKTEEKTASEPGAKDKEKGENQPKLNVDTVRIAVSKIDKIYLLAEEALQIKLSHNEEKRRLDGIEEQLTYIKTKWIGFFANAFKQKETKIVKTQQRYNISSENINELENINSQIKGLEKELKNLKNFKSFVANYSTNIIDNLIDEIKELLMVPFFNLLDSFPRIVRDLARSFGKKVSLEISGSEIEVDRRIMESLKDPILHIIRNAVDHGIETPETRVRKGKSEVGSIKISITNYDANMVQIDIIDDGKGINAAKLLQKAINNKQITKEEAKALNDEQTTNLIFKSGLSTSSIITDISGRGLGMAIVEENVEKLGGRIHIKNRENKGCTISLIIPTSMSKAQGLIVRVNKSRFILPVANVLETKRIEKNAIKKVENRETIQYKNEPLTLISLGQILGIPKTSDLKHEKILVLVLESLGKKIGLLVDAVDNEQAFLFKALTHPIKKLRNVSGVSLLGDGSICPILNGQDIIRTSLNITGTTVHSDAVEQKEDRKKSVLMAEDSITSRLFLKNILESAGYNVKATVDGKEAFIALKQQDYDILISDVEMPRMNGFELTKAVRNEDKFKDLPIVLVTSLSKQEHQEQGIEAGANAYIIKSSFEQSNLLEVVKRLI